MNKAVFVDSQREYSAVCTIRKGHAWYVDGEFPNMVCRQCGLKQSWYTNKEKKRKFDSLGTQ